MRLNAGLGAEHWKKEAGGKWDGGYQHTAHFLDYLEGRFGEGSVRNMNQSLRSDRYEEKLFWKGLFGEEVERLWEQYLKTFEEEGRGGDVPEQAEAGQIITSTKAPEPTPTDSQTSARKTDEAKKDDDDDDEPVLVEAGEKVPEEPSENPDRAR